MTASEADKGGASRESETMFRRLAENGADIVWILDLETQRFRYVSPMVERVRGFTAEEVLAGMMRDSLTEESQRYFDAVVPPRLAAFQSGLDQTYIDVVELPNKDGTTAWVEIYSRIFANESTGHLEVYGSSRVVTARREAESALKQTTTLLRRAEEFARFGHWELTLDDQTMVASDGAVKVYGVDADRAPVQQIKDCALSEYRPYLDARLRGLIERGEPYDVEFQIRRPSDGAVVWVASRAEYDARRRRVFGVVQDITERKRIETERENLIAELQSSIEHIKTLKGIVPICASCKKIRDDKGYWEAVEHYLSRHTEALFSHGICPDCSARLYPDEG